MNGSGLGGFARRTVGQALAAPLLHRRLVGRAGSDPPGPEGRRRRRRRRPRGRTPGSASGEAGGRRGHGTGLEHRGREVDERHQAAGRAGAELDGDGVAGGERADDVETEGPREREADDRRLGEQRVRLDDALRRHADALVGDREHEPGRGDRARDDDRGVGRRERRSRSRAARRGGGRRRTPRGPTPRASSSMPTSSTRGKSAISAAAARTTSSSAIGCCHCRGCSAPGEHEEALGVASHAGRHVVELEQRVERGGVVLVALELVEQLELTLEQALVAAGQVHEQVAHALAQQARLLLRDLHGHGLDVVERLGELADLVLRLHVDARRLHRARRRRRCAGTRPARAAGAATSRAPRR